MLHRHEAGGRLMPCVAAASVSLDSRRAGFPTHFLLAAVLLAGGPVPVWAGLNGEVRAHSHMCVPVSSVCATMYGCLACAFARAPPICSRDCPRAVYPPGANSYILHSHEPRLTRAMGAWLPGRMAPRPGRPRGRPCGVSSSVLLPRPRCKASKPVRMPHIWL